MNEHSQGLVIKWVSLQDLKSHIRCHQKMLISKSKNFTKNLRNSVRKKGESGETLESGLRKCSNCGVEQPLDEQHYQRVKYFQTGFSYHCNLCNAPKVKDND